MTSLRLRVQIPDFMMRILFLVPQEILGEILSVFLHSVDNLFGLDCIVFHLRYLNIKTFAFCASRAYPKIKNAFVSAILKDK